MRENHKRHKLQNTFIQDFRQMFTQEYPVYFSYPLDEERSLLTNLAASVRWQPYSGTYIVNEFYSSDASGLSITLPEIRIRKREGMWVHTDSEAETRLSLIVGRAIDIHEESGGSFMAVLEHYLDSTIKLHNADCGNIQLFDPQAGMIQMLAHRGFQKSFVDYFKYVSADDGTVCGNAMRHRDINFVSDIMQDEAYVPHREIIRSAGIHSVKSYPLVLPDNSFAGVISAHWKRTVSEEQLPDASPSLTGLTRFLQENKTRHLI
jgi:hypothetical protein